MRSEADFIGSIDCRFPYSDTASALSLIEEGCEISGNAAFMVVHELTRLPVSASVDDATRLLLLDELEARLTHPLKGVVLDVARRMVRGESLPFEECCAVLNQIAAHPGEYNALGLVYFSCEESGMVAIDAVYNRILDGWLRSSKA